MGMAVVDKNKNVNLYSSDQPHQHIDQAKQMESIMENYLASDEGKSLVQYLGSRSKKPIEIKGYGAGDLGENVVAAVLHDGIEGVILSNYNGKDFTTRIDEMADKYDLSSDDTMEYVLAHELAHAAGYKSEAETENVIKEYFEFMALNSDENGEKGKYESLAKVAEERCEEAKTYH
jgi:hypothetical protein